MALGHCRAGGFLTMNSRAFVHRIRAKMGNALREIRIQKYGKELPQTHLRRKKPYTLHSLNPFFTALT